MVDLAVLMLGNVVNEQDALQLTVSILFERE